MKGRKLLNSLMLSVLVAGASVGIAAAAPPVSGAIFTTDSTCTRVNQNIYASKPDVYLDGGPAHPGAAGLPDGSYYVQVTSPAGNGDTYTVLGTSLGTDNPTPVHVTNGNFDTCYQLWAILIQADGSQGYADTPNPGGEYKVWVSNEASFINDSTKTDNFKVRQGEPVVPARLRVLKFYDANADGVYNAGDSLITGWKIGIQDGMNLIRYTPVDVLVDAPDLYTIWEFLPIETNWSPTTVTSVQQQLNPGDDTLVTFGNLCVGPGGGLTLGFWSNKNGQALVSGADLAFLTSLNLRNAAGSNFDPATYSALRTWLLNGTATNMAYMLSVQLTAMELNVQHNFVNAGSLIYAPGTQSANALGYATVGSVMAEANAELGLHGLVLSDSPYRAYQEALKNALDRANNNQTFVQPSACPFSFAP